MDWRSMRQLQTHIVIVQKQAKGTIGGLAEALERYGVPVTEAQVESHQRREHSLAQKLDTQG